MAEIIETWKPVPGFESFYEVSDLGNVVALFGKMRPRRQYPYRGGRAVDLLIPGESTTRVFVHRIVLMAFRPLPAGYALHQLCVKFLDGDKQNCRLSNLEWSSWCGDDAPNRKLSSDQVEQIRAAWVNHPEMTLKEIAQPLGVSITTVSLILSGETWTSYGLSKETR